MKGRPLERDYWLVLQVPLQELLPWLNTPAAVTSWFPAVHRDELGDGSVEIAVPGATISGSEQWIPESPAVVFTALNGSISAFLTIRAIIISGHPGTGTEVWIHLEAQDSPRSRGILRSFEPFIRSGLAYMESELGVTA